MADKSSPTISSEEALSIICELREVSTRHEQLLEKVGKLLHEENLSAWKPPPERGDEIEHIQSSLKIRKVVSLHAGAPDILGRLRMTRLGRAYTTNLKQYYVVRWVVQWIWRYGYPIYVNHITPYFVNRESKRWRPLTKLSDFAKRRKIPICKLADAAIVETLKPKVFPTCEQGLLTSPQDQYRFPEIFVATIKNAMTYGGTNLVLVDGEVICHDLYDFKHDYTSEELHGRTRIHPRTSRIRWLLHDDKPEPIAEAATFVDACAENYAHWMTEVMPRLVLFCANEKFKDVPIVVNEGLHQNLMESLLLVAGTDREIFTLPTGRALAVGKLYLTSVAGYVPFGRRNNKLSGHSHGVFSPPALEMLHKHLTGLGRNNKDYVWPERIFLRRNSGTRKVYNMDELEKLLVVRGYVIVETEKLTFMQQIRLFQNVKEVIAPTGAALANAIFCMPETRVTILMGKHEDMIYRYWCNMLTPIKIKVSYVLGDIVQNKDLGIHGDFLAGADDIINLLETLVKK